jgi:hypothetical protein
MFSLYFVKVWWTLSKAPWDSGCYALDLNCFVFNLINWAIYTQYMYIVRQYIHNICTLSGNIYTIYVHCQAIYTQYMYIVRQYLHNICTLSGNINTIYVHCQAIYTQYMYIVGQYIHNICTLSVNIYTIYVHCQAIYKLFVRALETGRKTIFWSVTVHYSQWGQLDCSNRTSAW